MRRRKGGKDGIASADPSRDVAAAGAAGRIAGEQPSGQVAGRKPDRRHENRPGTLYLVATPIGNLGDVTLRALETLAKSGAIACEDTRVTARLLARHGIARPMIAYHDHNAERVRPRLLDRLGRGEDIALVSDAGSPLVSDPGFKLVREAVARGVPVTAVPGPSAAIAALQLSGLPGERFFFAGFPPAKAAARRKALRDIKDVPGALIFFETAPRLAAALADMADALGDRPAAVARELTKMFEEVRRDSLAALARHYAEAGPPKGEIAIVVARAGESPRASNDAPLPGRAGEKPVADAADVDRLLGAASARLPPSAAAAEVARATGLPRRELYRRALELKRK
jgi:16S rRNA (cytidine1402-2'-O)-methyltransferase